MCNRIYPNMKAVSIVNSNHYQAPERCSKLYDSYCKFLLSYDTLPAEEKQRLEQQVLSERDKGQPSPNDDCVHKVSGGRQVYRVTVVHVNKK